MDVFCWWIALISNGKRHLDQIDTSATRRFHSFHVQKETVALSLYAAMGTSTVNLSSPLIHNFCRGVLSSTI